MDFQYYQHHLLVFIINVCFWGTVDITYEFICFFSSTIGLFINYSDKILTKGWNLLEGDPSPEELTPSTWFHSQNTLTALKAGPSPHPLELKNTNSVLKFPPIPGLIPISLLEFSPISSLKKSPSQKSLHYPSPKKSYINLAFCSVLCCFLPEES